MSQNITNGSEKIRIKPGKLVKLGALVAPAICLGYSLVVLALSSKPIPLWLWVVEFFVVAIVVAVSIWAVYFMRVEIKKDSSSNVVRIKAPFYSRSVSHKKISDISVGEDSGMNSGLINWFVTGRARSRNGVRINVGGSAHVRFAVEENRRFTIVTEDMSQAERLVALLSSN